MKEFWQRSQGHKTFFLSTDVLLSSYRPLLYKRLIEPEVWILVFQQKKLPGLSHSNLRKITPLDVIVLKRQCCVSVKLKTKPAKMLLIGSSYFELSVD